MNAPAAFQATYFTHRPIVTRNCVQLVFEVPSEQLLDVLRMLQPPQPCDRPLAEAQRVRDGGAVSNPGGNHHRRRP